MPDASDASDSRLRRLPTDPGLCRDCIHRRILTTERTAYVRCELADSDPRFTKYPRLPVLRCAGYERAE